MADLASLVQKFLSTSEKPTRLNYYSVLELDELQDDRTTIASAVETAIEKLKAADRKTDAAGFEQVVKVVRQARATLLDEEKKRAYDLQLKGLLKKSGLPASDSGRLPSEAARLLPFLPSGDPSAPFSMADFLKMPHVQPDFETAAQRHVALAEFANPPVAPISNPSLNPMNGSMPGLVRPTPGQNSGRELQQMIRRNRQKKNLIAAGVLIGFSLVVLFIGVGMFITNRWELQRQTALNGADITIPSQMDSTTIPSNVPPGTGSMNAQERAAKRMNLGVNSKGPKGKVGELPKLGVPDEPVMPTQEKKEESVPEPMKPAMTPPAPVDPPGPPMKQPIPDPTKKPGVSIEPNMTVQAPEVMEKKVDTSKWREVMMDARKAIEEKNFEKFSVDMEKALNLSPGDAQEEQRQRLDKFGQLYQKGLEILNGSITELKSQEEIRYGSTGRASVVEKKDNELILRISGKNETYTFDKLPLGIVLAIMEMKMNDSPIDQAIRGIICITGSRNTPASKKQAQAFFEKAAAADNSFAKLDQALQENLQ